MQRAARRAGGERAPAGLTMQQARLMARLLELQGADDSRGVVASERKALALAREVRGPDRVLAVEIFNILGVAFRNVGDYERAREMNEQHRAMAEELGDRAGVARACENLGSCYRSMRDYLRAREMHEQALAIWEALGDCAGVARACSGLGHCYHSTGDFGRAREMHEQHRAICEALGDRDGMARACSGLGNCYHSTGDYARAREMYEQHRAVAEELGDRGGVANACENLGLCYHSTGDYVRAREMHEQALAICEALGDRAGVASACGNLGVCYHSTGDYGRARELYEKDRSMAEALGDRESLARACGSLGHCYESTGDYGRARELHEQALAICEALGDRAGVARACGSLGLCYLNTGDYRRAVSCFTEQHIMAKKLQVAKEMTDSAFGLGVALRLEVRANVRGRAAGASELPGPPSSACENDRVREAEKWLQTVLRWGDKLAYLHLAHLAFDAGHEDTALAHLQDYLSWCVERGRSRCAGCYQKRGEDAQMLTCGGCRVTRFCSADHQKMASKSVASGRWALLYGRHKDVCGVLGKWRQVVKDGMSPGVLRADLLACLRQ